MGAQLCSRVDVVDVVEKTKVEVHVPPRREKNYLFAIYRGDFRYLPDCVVNSIKIFLSSTTKDYRLERDFIIEAVYTDLREYFKKQYDVDFTLIDLRWGIRREQALSNATTQFCIDEVKKCLRESIGPAFITFLSHRYGTAPLREEIEKSEFERCLAVIEENGELIRRCYELDENDIGEKRCYKLKSMKEILGVGVAPDFKKEEEEKMLKTMRSSALLQLNETQSRKYFISVTEEEILNGVMNNQQANETSLAFYRNILYSDKDENAMKRNGYLDANSECQVWLAQLKRNLETTLSPANQIHLEISWSESNGLAKENEHTKRYLRQFGESLKASMSQMIDNGMRKQSEKLSEDDLEIIHHASFCNNLLKNFIERTEYSAIMRKYLNDSNNTRPFLVHGPSGSGKSSIMASVIRQEESNAIIAIRFMGTSRLSSNAYSVMKSLIYQFKKLFPPDDEIQEPNDAWEASDYLFNRILTSENTRGQKVVILLDSIDQLHESDHDLAWVVYNLPQNVKVVYSTLAEHDMIFESLGDKLDANYMEIKKLEFKAAMEQLKQRLNLNERDLQPNQWSLVNECLSKTREIYPLHMKLLFDITVKWRSTVSEKSLEGCVGIKETIGYLFKRHELHFGPICFSHFIFYLTVFKNGVSESELEDILSIDDQVLDEVFDKYDPPVRRFPNSILVRLRDALKDYLTQKQGDDVLLISWFHRSFYEASQEIYVHLFQPSPKRDILLQNIIDYFTEKWREEPKEYKWERATKRAPRYTKSQVIRSKSKYNKRKLNEFLNIVLLLTNETKKADYLLNEIYLNYEFMHSKAQLHDLEFVMSTLVTDLRLVELSNIYVSQYGTISAYPDSVLYEVVSRVDNKLADRMRKSVADDNFVLIPLGGNKSKRPTDGEQVLFVKNDKMANFSVCWMYNSPYALLKYYHGNTWKVKIINRLSGKLLTGKVEVPGHVHFLYLNKTPKHSITNINGFDGAVVYTEYNKATTEFEIRIRTFQNASYCIKTCVGVNEILLVSSKALLLVCKQSFEIVNFKDPTQPIDCYKSELFDEVILDVQTTSRDFTREVFMPEFHSIENTVMCMVLKGSIKVYNYESKTCSVSQLADIVLGYDIYYKAFYDSGCMIDRNDLSSSDEVNIVAVSQTDNNKKFKLNEEFQIKLLIVYKNESKGITHKTVDFKKSVEDLLEEAAGAIKIYDLSSKQLIFGVLYNVKYEYKYRYICLFDTKQNAVVRKIEQKEIVGQEWWYITLASNEDKLLFDSRVNKRLCVYEIEEGSFKMLDFQNDVDQWALVDENTLMVQFEAEIKSITLDGIDASSARTGSKAGVVKIGQKGEIYGFINDEQLLVKRQLESEGSFEICVVNAGSKEIVSSASFNGRMLYFDESRIISRSPSGSLEVFSVNGTNIDKLETMDGSIEWSSKVKCLFLKQQFLVSDFDKYEKKLKVFRYEVEASGERVELAQEFSFSDFTMRDDKTPPYCITGGNILVYLSFTGSAYELCCKSMETGRCFGQSKLKLNLKGGDCAELLALPLDNDFIIHVRTNKYFLHFKINLELVTQKKVKLDNKLEIHDLKLVSGNLLSIDCWTAIVMYDVNTMTIVYTLDEDAKVTVNTNYFIFTAIAQPKRIRVFRMNERKQEEVCTLPLAFDNLQANDKYVCVRIENNNELETFEIKNLN